MILNAWQRAIARTYGDGDYAHLAGQAEVFHEELADCGDTLFELLMIELSDQEDCEDVTEALRRMAQARDQIDAAVAVLAAL